MDGASLHNLISALKEATEAVESAILRLEHNQDSLAFRLERSIDTIRRRLDIVSTSRELQEELARQKKERQELIRRGQACLNLELKSPRNQK